MTAPFAAARVLELRPSRLGRYAELQTRPDSDAAAVVLGDFADCAVAVHALANLAGLSVRVRAFLFNLAALTGARSSDTVELCDQEFADLQGCSVKTVERQRRDYLKESRERGVNLVEVVEGERVPVNGGGYRHEPSRYRYTLGEAVARVVIEARASGGWADVNRARQIEIIARVAEDVYHDIPDAPARRRKRKRARAASAEVMTCQRTAKTHLAKLRARAKCLTAAERIRLREGQVVLREGQRQPREEWLELRAEMDAARAEMDALFGTGESQASDCEEVGQLVPTGLGDGVGEAVMSPEDDAAWEGLKDRHFGPDVRTVGIALGPPEPVPRELTYESDGGMTVEEFEAEAVRAEANGERAPWERAP